MSRAQPLHLDCANGVGAAKLAGMTSTLARAGLCLELHNTGAGTLNHLCGSDFVQKDKAMPEGFEGVGLGARCAAWMQLKSTQGGHAQEISAHLKNEYSRVLGKKKAVHIRTRVITDWVCLYS